MLVQSAKKERGHLLGVVCDDGSEFKVDLEILENHRIKKGVELTRSDIISLLKESDYIRAKSRASYYLNHCDYTEKMLYSKLVTAKFSSESAQKVIKKFRELGLLDDRRYAENFSLKCYDSNMSKRQTMVKLLEKGVPNFLAKEVVDQSDVDESAHIKAIIDKKYKNKLDTKENTAKVYAALVRKGFSYGTIRDVLKEYSEELAYAEEDIYV